MSLTSPNEPRNDQRGKIWWHVPAILVIKGQRQEAPEFEVSLAYILRVCLKKSRAGTGENAQLVKCLVLKRDLSSCMRTCGGEKLGMMAHAYNPKGGEVETEGSLRIASLEV